MAICLLIEYGCSDYVVTIDLTEPAAEAAGQNGLNSEAVADKGLKALTPLRGISVSSAIPKGYQAYAGAEQH